MVVSNIYLIFSPPSKLQSALAGCELVDVGEAAAQQRMVKSKEEIEVSNFEACPICSYYEPPPIYPGDQAGRGHGGCRRLGVPGGGGGGGAGVGGGQGRGGGHVQTHQVRGAARLHIQSYH